MLPNGRPSVSVAVPSDPAIVVGLVRETEDVVTPHQLELLALYASGFAYAEIGALKFLSQHTVKKNLALALRRSGARNLTHLCSILIARGVIERAGDGFRPIQDLRIAE